MKHLNASAYFLAMFFSMAWSALAQDEYAQVNPVNPVEIGKKVSWSIQSPQPNFRYEWNTGLEILEGPTPSFTFSEPGRYSVLVDVFEGDQFVASGGFIQVVYRPLAAKPAQTSRTLLLADSEIWVVNPDADRIAVVAKGQMQRTHSIPVGKNPVALALGSNNQVWVVNRKSWDITLVNQTTKSVEKRIALPYASQPSSIIISPDKQSAFVCLAATGTVVKLSTQTHEILGQAQIDLPEEDRTPFLEGMAMDGEGQTLVVTQMISSRRAGHVFLLNPTDLSLIKQVELQMDQEFESSPEDKGLPNYLAGATFSRDGLSLWIPSKKDNIEKGAARDSTPLTHDLTVRSIVSKIELANQTENLAGRIDIDNADRAVAVEFSPVGDILFAATPGNHEIMILDASEGNEIGRLSTGMGPIGLQFEKGTNTLYVHSFLSRRLERFTLDQFFRGEGPPSEAEGVDLISPEHEKLAPEVLAGKKLFYEASSMKLNNERYMSCASCHLDGAEDGQVWDLTSLGEGFRNTIDLRGRRGTGHGPLHWSANFDEVHDFELQIRDLGAGSGLMEFGADSALVAPPFGKPKAGRSADLDALAAYVASLSEYPPSPHKDQSGQMTASALNGMNIFNRIGCAECHSGEDYTNSGKGLRHNVGTLQEKSGKRLGGPLLAFDVPTLRGIWATPPYLHDGSAKTLMEVLTTKNPNDLHGVTSSLSVQERKDLVAFLEQLDGDAPPAEKSGLNLAVSTTLTEEAIPIGVPVPISVNHTLADISEVSLFANGEIITTFHKLPFTTQWTPKQPGLHEISVLAKHGEKRETVGKSQWIFVESKGSSVQSGAGLIRSENAVRYFQGQIYLNGNQKRGKPVGISGKRYEGSER